MAAAAPPPPRKRALRDQALTKAGVLVGIGRDGFSRGVLLVKAKDGKPMVVGLGTEEMGFDGAASFCRRAVAYLKADLPAAEADVVLDDDHAPIITNLNNGLLVAYLVDQGDRFEYVQRRHLIRSDIDEAQLYQIAIGNLAAMLSEREANLHKSGAAFVVFFDSNFEASLILLDSLWEEELAHLAPNGFIAAVPARDILAFCDAASEAGIVELRRIIERVEGADHPLKPILYRRDASARAWQPYAV